ncbi:MAG: tyrosine-type recombinase/integrase [Treponema sp.]|jgi:integrase|nr:tyrosine-type recombinase/integrase [Treponema sp.]
MDTVTQKIIKSRTTGTSDRNRANALAQEWLVNGLPDEPTSVKIAKGITFCEYLKQFWDFDTSEYFEELRTMGNEPHREHADEMHKQVDRYYLGFFGETLLCRVTEESLQKFVVYLKLEKKLAASTVNSARNVDFVALRYAKQKKIISRFDFEAVIRAGGGEEERGILEREEAENLFAQEWRDLRARLINLIASQTGMRLGEIRALRTRDIREDRICVEHGWSRKEGLKSTKNRGKREIPVLPDLYEELPSYIKGLEGRFRLDSFLFPGTNPEKPYDNRQIGREFSCMLAKIGLYEMPRKIFFK